MKTPKIPSGWRKLRKGTFISPRDKFLYKGKWYTTTTDYKLAVGENGNPMVYIRMAPKHKSHARKK